MQKIDEIILEFMESLLGKAPGSMAWLLPVIIVLTMVAIAYIATLLFRYLVIPVVQRITEKTKATWDDYIFNQRVLRAMQRLIPPIIFYILLPEAFQNIPPLLDFSMKVCQIYITIMTLLLASAFCHSLYEISEEHKKLKNRPLKGIYQMFNLLAVVVGCILIISILMDKSAGSVLTGLGASAAILMLVFKDSVLGLVAGVQLSANDMLRPGDWITMAKYGANGFVKEVTLTTVKVQNFDKTITTIPPYLLASDSFQNWRGMREAGGRRLKKSININMDTMHFCGKEEIERLQEEGLVSKEKYKDMDRPIGNAELFRDYMMQYMKTHPKVNHNLMIMVRELQPTAEGLPIELYCFATTPEWLPCERLQSEIIDHAIISARAFGLEVFQRPAGTDFKEPGKA